MIDEPTATTAGEAGVLEAPVEGRHTGVSPLQTVCAALLPCVYPILGFAPGGSVACLDGWQVHEIAREDLVARVGLTRRPAAAAADAAAPARATCIVDLVREVDPAARRGGDQRPPAVQGAWLLTHVMDLRQGLAWDVYSAPGGATWRMSPRYAPDWLRAREREVMARLRGAQPLPRADPLAAAAQGTPIWLDPLHAALQEQERDRATVAYGTVASPTAPVQPCYVVKLRWRRLSLRPYRSLGFWLIDGVARVRGPA